MGTLILHGLGIVFLVLAGLYYWYVKRRKDPSASIHYTLTNQRAIVLDVSNKNNATITGECNLKSVVAISQNKTGVSQSNTGNVSISIMGNNVRPQQSKSIVIGDVAFLEGTSPRIMFQHIIDPDGVVKTVEEIKKSMYAG